MSVATMPTVMTTEDLLALPENGFKRWLIRGKLRQQPMTVRNRWHSRLLIRIAFLLESWLELQPLPRGSVLGGEVGVRLRRNPDTTVGIDLIYIAAALAAQEMEGTTLIDGVPVLAVEILSPSDTEEQINEKVDDYLLAGVQLVWVIDPHDRTVTIYRPNQAPELVNIHQELSGEPHLPGFRVPVSQIFA